jgi:hypothetical protein
MTQPAVPDGMIEHRVVGIDDLSSAARLSDLISVKHDLQYVLWICDRLSREDLEHEESSLVRALWSAALVGYFRCFSHGKRQGLNSDLFLEPGVDENAVAAHEYLRSMRNKHIAHSVNPFERIRMAATMLPPGAEGERISGLLTLTLWHLSESIEGIANLRNLSIAALGWVEKQLSVLGDQVLAEARRVDPDLLYSRP